MQWFPGETQNKRRAVPAYHHDLLARFCKESSLSKSSWCPEFDYIDVGARQENLAVRGEPIMLQLPLVPAYSLTILKTQADFKLNAICLTIKLLIFSLPFLASRSRSSTLSPAVSRACSRALA